MAYSKTQVDRAGRKVIEVLDVASKSPRDLGRHKDEFFEALEIVEWWRGEHARPLSRVAANLRHYASQEGKPIVAQRLKRAPTISDKLGREPKMKLSRMADIGGVRAVLPSQVAAYKVASRIRKNWTITRFRDYVAEPKEDGYRALHLINRNHGRLVEIQLRTPNQDAWANYVEVLSRTFAPGFKFGMGPPWLRGFFSELAEVFAQADAGMAVDLDALDNLRTRGRELVTLLEENMP